jgi:Na+/H+ antiporter NhaD/arsenite permease-like protein
MYFWATGILSSFLDNAPTYLVFFNTAGGDPEALMGPMANTLLAISAGAVFMGANTYIGNAPNFMVRSIAEERGIPMPSFFGYMLWSGLILLPIFGLITILFFV